MRKYFAIILVLGALPSFVRLQTPQEPKRLPGRFLIYGPVHTIRDERTSFTQVNGELVEGERTLVMTATYSEDGTKQERTHYFNGNIINRVEETYAQDGRILESRLFRRGPVLESRTVSVYDDRKQLIEEVTHRADDSVSKRMTFRRDSKQLQIETVLYDAQGRIIRQSSTQNDLETHQARSISVAPERVIETRASTTRNADGSREYRQEGSDGNFSRQVVVQNGKGGEDRISYNKDGTIKEKVRVLREFDSYNNMIKTTHLTATGDSSEFRPTTITYRSITYYQKN